VKGEKGFALVITMIVTVLLVALCTEFIDEVYVDTAAGRNFVDGQQASLLAESGIVGGMKLLQLTLQGQEYSSLLDQWARPLQIADESGALEVTIEEETGKLDVNLVAFPNGTLFEPYAGIATRLFKKLALSPDLLDALYDWLDEDEEPRPGGAESSYYGTLKPPYVARNSKLETLEELGLVKGFSGKPLERLRPFVTVYADNTVSPAAPININTAPTELLSALDERMTDELASRVLDYRKTTPFKQPADLAKVAGLETIAIGLLGKIRVKGTVFRLRSLARTKETTRIIEAVVRLGGAQPTVLYWREY
jgi:general secretion pathway protein K